MQYEKSSKFDMGHPYHNGLFIHKNTASLVTLVGYEALCLSQKIWVRVYHLFGEKIHAQQNGSILFQKTAFEKLEPFGFLNWKMPHGAWSSKGKVVKPKQQQRKIGALAKVLALRNRDGRQGEDFKRKEGKSCPEVPKVSGFYYSRKVECEIQRELQIIQ
ncbi:hypothetical protein [Absidia glauca]|uniref:Uncharacterized protein n=1 Tax=Absidia glauca TaxID=4829 RepID=A0A168QEB3_ABSGL|nr:hypothetical protein [Absidia glauca]